MGMWEDDLWKSWIISSCLSKIQIKKEEGSISLEFLLSLAINNFPFILLTQTYDSECLYRALDLV